AVLRDAAQLGWRYPATPLSPYRQRQVAAADGVVAMIVVRVVDLMGLRLLFVMEWHCQSGGAGAARFLMEEAIELAGLVGAHGVTALATAGTPHRRLLRRLGFMPVPEWAFPKLSRMSVRIAPEAPEVTGWQDPRSWYVTWGDGLVL